MMLTTPATRRPIQLHCDGGKVVVTPEDEDRFVMASRHAVSACVNALVASQFIKQFRDDFLMRLHNWCAERPDQVDSCYVPFPLPASCIKVFVVAKRITFDFELSDLIADLEVEMDKAGWPCDVLQISPGTTAELNTFFDPCESLQVFEYGHSSTTSGKG